MSPSLRPLLLSVLFLSRAAAADYAWQTNGTSTAWNTTDANWYVDGGTTLTPWTDGNNAVFSGTGGSLTVPALRSLTGLTFNGGNWTIDGSASANGDDYYSLGGTATLTVNAGNVTMTNTFNQFTGGTVVNNGGTLTLGGSDGEGLITGTVTVNAGGTLVFTGADSMGYNDGSKIDVVNLLGGRILATSGNAGWGVAYNLTGATMTATGDGTFTFGGNGTNTSVTTLASSTTSVIAGSVTLRTDGGLTNVDFTVADGAATTDLNVSAGIVGSGGGITKLGAGTMALSGINTYSGATHVNAGTLVLGGSGKLESSAISVAGGATLRIDSTGKTLDSLSVDGGAALKIAAAAGVTTTVTNGLTLGAGSITVTPIVSGLVTAGNVIDLITAGSVTNSATLVAGIDTDSRVRGTLGVSGNILQYTVTTGAANLTWNVAGGTGAWNLNGAANFDNAGVNDKFFNADAVTFADGAGAGNKTVTVSGTVAPGQVSVINSTSGGSYTFAGNGIGGGATLLKDGDGTLILANNNTFSGTTTITGGTLQVGAGGTVGSLGTGSVVNNAAISFDRSDNAEVSNLISGAGTLTKNGAGTLVLSAANTYTGLTTVNAGVLEVIGNGGSKMYSVGTGGTLRLGYSTGQYDYNYGVTVNGAGVAATTGLQLSGGAYLVFQNALTLQTAPTTVDVHGAGNATLAGWDYNGTHLAVTSDASGSVIGSAVNFTTGYYGYTMNIASGSGTATGDLLIKGVMAGSGQYFKNGAGSVRLTGANTFTGAFNLNAGKLITGNIAALGQGAITVASGATLKVGDGTVNTVTLGSAANLVIAGILQLGSTGSQITLGSGSYNFTGGTLDLNGLFNGVSGTQQFTLITGGTGNTDGLSGITGYNSSLVSASFSQGILTVTAVPEPSVYGLAGAGALGLAAIVRRRRKVA